jgi:hypothetical protein
MAEQTTGRANHRGRREGMAQDRVDCRGARACLCDHVYASPRDSGTIFVTLNNYLQATSNRISPGAPTADEPGR